MSTIEIVTEVPVQQSDVVIETRQPSESVSVLMGRASDHIRDGAKAVLLLDPKERRVCVVRYDELPYTVGVESVVTLRGILPALAIPVAKFFE